MWIFKAYCILTAVWLEDDDDDEETTAIQFMSYTTIHYHQSLTKGKRGGHLNTHYIVLAFAIEILNVPTGLFFCAF